MKNVKYVRSTEKRIRKRKRNYWYKRYIKKMKYLEENYRKTIFIHNIMLNLKISTNSVPISIPMAVAEPVVQSHSVEEPVLPVYHLFQHMIPLTMRLLYKKKEIEYQMVNVNS